MSNIPQTTSEVLDVIGEKIGAIAEQLQLPAEQLLDFTVGGLRMEGIIWILLFGFAAFVGLFLLKNARLSFDKTKDFEEQDDPLFYFFFFVGLGLLLILFIVAVVGVKGAILRIFMPEYFILKELLLNKVNIL